MSARSLVVGALAPCLLVVCAVVAGCGEDAPSSDANQIASVLARYTTSADVEVLCETAVSDRFVQDVYGNLKRCRSVNTPEPGDDIPTGATITHTRVDADKATAGLTVVGTAFDGVSGRVALVRTEGDWKLDRFGVAFLRSAIEHVPAALATSEGRERARCFVRASRRLASRSLRLLGNALFGERLKDMPDAVTDCLFGR